MNEAARVRWDDGRREPTQGAGREASDPLAELARLVGQGDPYRDMFRTAPQGDERGRQGEARPPSDPDASRQAPDRSVHADLTDEWHASAAFAEHGHPEPEEHAWGDDGYHPEQGHVDADPYYAAAMAAAHRDDAGIADAEAALEGAEASVPDLWASGGAGGLGTAPRIDQAFDPVADRTRGGGSARRPLLVLAAVLVLTGGGLAASFLAKGGTGNSAAATGGRGAPTILAAAGPTKVKQEDPGATAPEDKDAALLNKGAETVAGPAKVVQSEEQPTDLALLPKAGDGASAAPNPYPEAKKVKTFIVHPNGTPIYDDGQGAADASQPAAPSATAEGATPKAAGKGVSTPPSPTIASLVADPTAPPPGASAATPASPKHDKAKPVSSTGKGSFGLQLAASPSETDANAAFAKLKKKYPAELGSLTASVHQSDTGGKPVFRVRVGGMSRDEASALCSKLMAGGGSCFVVHD